MRPGSVNVTTSAGSTESIVHYVRRGPLPMPTYIACLGRFGNNPVTKNPNRSTMPYCLHTRQVRTTVSCLLVIVLTLAHGCAKRPSDSESQQPPQISSVSKPVAVVTRSPTTSDKALTPEEMPSGELEFSKRYRQADSYSDVALLTLSRLLDDGRIQKTETKVETRFSKPHRIQLRVTSEDNSVIIISDGKHIATRIVDPITENFHGQMVFRKMGEKLSFADLYQVTELVDPIAPNEMLSALLAVPAGLDVLPLSILLEEGKLAELAGPRSAHATLGQMELPTGEHCDVVQIDSTEGKYRLWIDGQTLRRIEMPPLSRDLLPGVKQLSLSIDLSKVSFTAADSDFHIDQGGTKVRHFVLPPIPPMTERLGEQIAPLRFLNQNRQEVRVANDEDQATVLVWYGDHPESRMVLQSIEQVRRRNRSDRVRLAAVARRHQRDTATAGTMAGGNCLAGRSTGSGTRRVGHPAVPHSRRARSQEPT